MKVKLTPGKLCSCPGIKPGRIKVDPDQHLPWCRFYKRSKEYVTKTSVIPDRVVDGVGLGFVLGGEEF